MKTTLKYIGVGIIIGLVISVSGNLLSGCPSRVVVPEDEYVDPYDEEVEDIEPTDQMCKVEWYGGVTYKDRERLVHVVNTVISSTNCTAPYALCIFILDDEEGECGADYIFRTVDDIPEKSYIGKCGEYVIRYDTE